MKKQLLMMGMLVLSGISFAQTDRLWSRKSQENSSPVFENMKNIDRPRIFHLDLNGLKSALARTPKKATERSSVIISLPNSLGEMERFRITENSNFDAELAAKYPDIKSYVGKGLKDQSSTVYFSISHLGLSSMEIYGDRSAVFIEPYSKDLSTYAVYKRSDRKNDLSSFECKVLESAQKGTSAITTKNADDAVLRTFRLALACTGEYTDYFGGTKADALAAMNNTMTRVNGIFENDFAARMVLIPNNDAIVYTDANNDPFSPSWQMGKWNFELMNALSSTIGNANFDIGHLFGATGGGGDAGCIGCICSDDMSLRFGSPQNYKGSGYTSPLDGVPRGDTFDIDFVAHEMGHQFGGNHTWSYTTQGDLQPVEPGSGSTIMGYAGITNYDVQPHSTPFFHAQSIEQITNNIKSKTCSVNIPTGNSIPTADAGADYTIPKSTPFVLTGSGTDADGDSLTYIWEQMDMGTSSQTGSNSAATATKTAGPTFRSWAPSSSPIRYFPLMTTILAGATETMGTAIKVEALSSVSRDLNFRLTVRDNRSGGAGNNSDDTKITVNAAAGPFIITSQNAAISYMGGTSQTVTWDVAGTTANNINASNVDILWSTDNGENWTTLVAGTPNDGSEAVTIPNIATTSGRIMVKGSNHIFFDVNNADISVTPGALSTSETQLKDSKEIKLYPNPVKDILTLSNTQSEGYKIYDMSGKLIIEGLLQNGSVNVSKLIKGNYVIQVGTFSKIFIKK